MNYTDMDLDTLFELTPEDADPAQPEGAEEQDTDAEPAGAYNDEGENEQDTDAEPDEDTGKQTLTPEQRHANAARRRAAELEAVRQEERAKAKADMDAFVKSLGQKDTYDGNRSIETREQYDAYLKKRGDKALERTLARSGLTKEQLDAIVDARLAERAPAEEAPAAQAQPDTGEVDRQYAEIRAMDPDAPSLNDLAKDESYTAAVRRTGSMVKAYVERLKENAAQLGRHDAQIRAQSKAHLQRTSTRGTGAIEVTPEMRAAYRVFDPEITDDEIRKYEAKDRARRQK